MASQKHWQDECEDNSNSIDIEHSGDELLTAEEAEAIFRFECKQWIKEHQAELLNSPFKEAYKRPWTKKSSSTAFLKTTPTGNGGKKKIGEVTSLQRGE